MKNRKVTKKVAAVRRFKSAHGKDHSSIVFLGAGNLGGSVLKSLISKKLCTKKDVFVLTKTPQSSSDWKKWGVRASHVWDESVLSSAKEIWLAVKPSQFAPLIEKLNLSLSPNAVVYSLMAGWGPSKIQRVIKSKNIVCIMTNTAASLNKGSFVCFAASSVSKSVIKKTESTLNQMGLFCGFYNEAKMPQMTAMIGSFPAFYLNFLSQYLEFAKTVGLSPKESQKWFEYLSESAMALVDSPSKIDDVISKICTPGGCTEVGVRVLNQDQSLKKALIECSKKSLELSR